jgi:branched-subunit amino acid ABC-type transport system permease component
MSAEFIQSNISYVALDKKVDSRCKVWEIFLIQGLVGLSFAMNLFLIASGVTLIYGALKVVNFAHGSLYVLGAFVTYTVTMHLIETGAGFWVAMIIAPIAVAIVGAVVEIIVLRRIYDQEHITQILATYAIVLILADVTKLVWGSEDRIVPAPEFLTGSVAIVGQRFPSYYLLVILIGLTTAAGLWALLYKTRLGTFIRAAASDRETAETVGLNVSRIFTVIFMLGCWLAGLGGTIGAPMTVLGLGRDIDVVLGAFIVVVVGGLGSFRGAVLASLIIGELHSIGAMILPNFAMAFQFIAMVVVLISRPWGLFGKPQWG